MFSAVTDPTLTSPSLNSASFSAAAEYSDADKKAGEKIYNCFLALFRAHSSQLIEERFTESVPPYLTAMSVNNNNLSKSLAHCLTALVIGSDHLSQAMTILKWYELGTIHIFDNEDGARHLTAIGKAHLRAAYKIVGDSMFYTKLSQFA